MKSLATTLSTLILGAVFAVPSAASAAEPATTVWAVDTGHSQVGFSVRHMMVANVRGRFTKFDGTLTLDEKNVTASKVEVSIDAASIDTSHEDRDKHLRSPDFFNVEKHPSITFKSSKVAKHGKDGLKVSGDLTINGVTKPVVLEVSGLSSAVKDPWGNTKRGASATTTINRKDFGLTWNKALETGGVIVGDEVKIELELELAKKS